MKVILALGIYLLLILSKVGGGPDKHYHIGMSSFYPMMFTPPTGYVGSEIEKFDGLSFKLFK